MSQLPSFTCPHCRQVYGPIAPDQVPQYRGQTITCTTCHQPFTVPADLGQQPPMPQPVAPGYMPQYAQPGAYGPRQSNGAAIASLILGLVSFCVPILASIPAIVLGVIGIKKTRDPQVGGKGMAIAGLVLGCISILLGLVQFAILIPAFSTAKERATRVQCASNLRQIGAGLMLYSNDHKAFPPDLKLLITDSYLSPTVFVCRSSGDTPASGADSLNAGGHLSYVYTRVRSPNAPANSVVVYEPPANHGGQGANFLFVDGHVEWITSSQAQQAIAEIESGQNPPPAFTGVSFMPSPGSRSRGR